VVDQLSELMTRKAESFDPVRITHVSVAAAGIAAWAKANLKVSHHYTMH